MSDPRPLIVVSRGAATDPVPYLRALEAAGCKTVERVPSQQDVALPASADGMMFCGGAAVHPSRFGQELDPSIRKAVDEPRDAMEWALMDQALERGLPILGICRGFQMINVYLGGSLTQNLKAAGFEDDHRPDAARDAIAHEVIASGGRLQEIFGSAPIGVNSIHRQGIKVLADELQPTVHTRDGLIEGYEDPRRNILAVQWHPEELIHHPVQQALFTAFAARALTRAHRTSSVRG